MVTIIFLQPDLSRQTVIGETGHSLMEAAVRNGVPGIDADCGGSCACATCHVYVEPEWLGKLPPCDGEEMDMLEVAMAPNEYSRLACQIRLTDELDGLTVRVPEQQQ